MSQTRCSWWAWPTVALVVALAPSGPACGRISFDHRVFADAGVDAPACTGDFLVDTPADDPGLTLNCQGAGCSLRAALDQANTRPRSTICLADGLAVIVASELAVTRDVTIAGPNASICGNGATRVFSVATTGALRLRDVTVCHGRLTDAPGAAVLVASGGTLDADGVVFDDHAIVSNLVDIEGGAVRADGDALVEIRRSTFRNNRIDHQGGVMGKARGGAFAIRGTSLARVVVEDTAFESNFATQVGGAMFMAIDAQLITLRRLLFVRNRSAVGAAIDINCATTGKVVVESSTFADNVASDRAVIYVCGSTTLRLAYCSASGNTGDLATLETAAGRAELVANALETGSYQACGGIGVGMSLGGNVADRSDVVCPFSQATDRVQAPMLAPLADNGGPTQTLALPPGSPAIDAAAGTCPSVDQRGLPRPAGGACDSGAFEAQ